jgi:hypothetical protein
MASSNSIISILIQAKDSATATLKQVSSQISDTGDAADDAEPKTSRLGSTLDTLGGRIRFVAETFAVYQLGGLISDFATNAVSAAGQLEQTNMSFQSLIGNAQQADQLFGQLTQYANLTPFQSKDVTDAAKQLLAFGQTAGDVITTVKQLGDVTSAGGGDLQALSLVTGQIFAQGKLRAQDMYQVINDGGAGLIKIMAANVGGMQKLTDEFDTGGIPAQQYFDAITEATSKGGFAFNGAMAQAQTFNGRLSTLKDSATQFGEALIGVHTDPQLGLQIQPGGLFDRMKGGIQGISDALQGWQPAVEAAVPQFINRIQDLGDKLVNYLGPSFQTLVSTINQDVTPALSDLWKNILQPLIDALGNLLVAGIKLAMDSLTHLIEFVHDQRDAILGVATAITVVLLPAFAMLGQIWAGLIIKSYVSAAKASFPWLIAAVQISAAFWLQMAKVTASFALTAAKAIIHAAATAATWVAQAVVASAAWVVTELPKIIVSMSVVAAKAIIHAVATSAVWVAQAAVSSAAWVVTELPKIILMMSVVAIKSALYAADTSLAWVLNATRVSFVWVTQELPKLVVGFATTSASAVAEAAVTSATWTASAAKTSAVWVVTELPKIVAGFIATSASATAQAAVSSANWIASASKSSAAWVITELPKIVASFVMTSFSATKEAGVTAAAWIASSAKASAAWVITELPKIISSFAVAAASAVTQAAITSAAWVSSAVTSSASYEAFAALVATPLVMPAIAIAAALASIALVADAVQSVIGAIDAMNNAKQAADNQVASDNAVKQNLTDLAANGTAAQKARAQSVYLELFGNVPKFALGTNYAPNAFVAGENGPELITGAQGARVTPANQTAQVLRNSNRAVNVTVNAYNNVDVNALIRKIGFRLATA